MNKRIAKLIEKSTTIIYSGPGEIEDFDKEKFARLLSADIAEFCSDIDGGENMFSRAIREEYGVE